MRPPHARTPWLERAQAVLIVTILVGSTLAFGGAVWWARPALGLLLGMLAACSVARSVSAGRFVFLRSPLPAIGALAIGLAMVQLFPLPGRLARAISPRARAAYTLGTLPDRALEDDPSARLGDEGGGRTPATVDRPATLRWAAGAAACLVLFCAAAHFADRLDRALLVWGCVVGSLFLVTTIGFIQLLGRTEGLYGFLHPGRAPAWAPSAADMLAAPGTVALRALPRRAGAEGGWAILRSDEPGALGGLPGGPGAYLALASLALPLALGVLLQLAAPRGARGGPWERLRQSGNGGLVGLLGALAAASAWMVGMQTGRVLAIPFAIGVVLAGLPAVRGTGLRGVAAGATLLVLGALVGGVVVGEAVGRLPGAVPLAERDGWGATRTLWGEAARVARDFPIVGSGLGSFAAIHPYYKAADIAPNNAQSGLLQWCAEAGLAGVGLLVMAGVWVVVRLPGALRRVGTADRALAWGLVGALAGFAAFSALHWTVEVAAVALAASAVGGTCHRWLAGGTDLFVARA